MLKCLCIFFIFPTLHADDSWAKQELEANYVHHCQTYSDIHEHLPVLRKLAKECSSVVEIGMRYMVSTWGIMQGLSENPAQNRSYLGIDIARPPDDILTLHQRLAKANGISFRFLNVNDLYFYIPKTELLFIDSLHTYCHLTYELETFSPRVAKYIALHDTSDKWSYLDDENYLGDYSEYPEHYDRMKRGLWPAVEDFLVRHPEWRLLERHYNNFGFTILERIRR